MPKSGGCVCCLGMQSVLQAPRVYENRWQSLRRGKIKPGVFALLSGVAGVLALLDCLRHLSAPDCHGATLLLQSIGGSAGQQQQQRVSPRPSGSGLLGSLLNLLHERHIAALQVCLCTCCCMGSAARYQPCVSTHAPRNRKYGRRKPLQACCSQLCCAVTNYVRCFMSVGGVAGVCRCGPPSMVAGARAWGAWCPACRSCCWCHSTYQVGATRSRACGHSLHLSLHSFLELAPHTMLLPLPVAVPVSALCPRVCPRSLDAPPPSSYLQSLQHENALALVLGALEPLDTRHLLVPASFVSRLITTAQEAFAVQYVQVGVSEGVGGWVSGCAAHADCRRMENATAGHSQLPHAPS
jgi:hypothetical protein